MLLYHAATGKSSRHGSLRHHPSTPERSLTTELGNTSSQCTTEYENGH